MWIGFLKYSIAWVICESGEALGGILRVGMGVVGVAYRGGDGGEAEAVAERECRPANGAES